MLMNERKHGGYRDPTIIPNNPFFELAAMKPFVRKAEERKVAPPVVDWSAVLVRMGCTCTKCAGEGVDDVAQVKETVVSGTPVESVRVLADMPTLPKNICTDTPKLLSLGDNPAALPEGGKLYGFFVEKNRSEYAVLAASKNSQGEIFLEVKEVGGSVLAFLQPLVRGKIRIPHARLLDPSQLPDGKNKERVEELSRILNALAEEVKLLRARRRKVNETTGEGK